MRTIAAVVLLAVVAGCGGASDSDDSPALSATQALERTCVEVRKGIEAFNDHDYAGTVRHFVKAEVPARVNAKKDPEPEADALLDAVEYYANLDPADYPDAARTSEHFARNKAITLGQCMPVDGPTDDVPTQDT
jgi:hypothetical protein